MNESDFPREIERKFKVRMDRLPFDPEDHPASRIEQGYLVVNEAEAREVRLRDRDGRYSLTVKTGAGKVRGEGEVEVSEDQFLTLWKFTVGRRILKTRYEIPMKGLTAELDVYGGRQEGLVVVEVEFSNADAAEHFEPPDWFGEEVTENEAYKNQRLALEQPGAEET